MTNIHIIGGMWKSLRRFVRIIEEAKMGMPNNKTKQLPTK